MVLSILSIFLYPFLCAWTVIGTLWFRDAKDCVSYTITPLTSPNYLSTSFDCFVRLVDACSCPKKDRNGASSFGCFSATVPFFALLACQWERLFIFCVLSPIIECLSKPIASNCSCFILDASKTVLSSG